MSDVNYTAEKFLAGLLTQGFTLPEVDACAEPNSASAYMNHECKEFIARIDAEFKARRYDVTETPQDVVIKNGHKYLYAEGVWTYDIRLAKRFRQQDAERLIRHFDGVSLAPAPNAPTPVYL